MKIDIDLPAEGWDVLDYKAAEKGILIPDLINTILMEYVAKNRAGKRIRAEITMPVEYWQNEAKRLGLSLSTAMLEAIRHESEGNAGGLKDPNLQYDTVILHVPEDLFNECAEEAAGWKVTIDEIISIRLEYARNAREEKLRRNGK